MHRQLVQCGSQGILLLIFSLATLQGVQSQVTDSKRSAWHGFLESQVVEQDESQYPLSWSPEDVAWSCELRGYGQSSPIVWGRQIYVTSVDGVNKERCLVASVDGDIGAITWMHEEPAEVPAESSRMISRAAPTPVCDEDGVYVFFETGNLLALTHSGQVRWQRNLQAEVGAFENKFGISSSLAQVEDKLFVLLDHDAASLLLAVHKTDGSDAWSVPRSNLGHSWTSPAIVRIDGQPLVVCSSIGSVDIYDPRNGAELVSHKSVGGNSVATPIDSGQGRFLVSSLIRPADGPVEGATKSNLLARISRQNDGFALDVEWIAENARGAFCSPILHRDYCYWLNPQGVLFCLDAATGKELYARRLPCGGCWATPLAIGERLYCFGRDGETVVVRVGDSYEELSIGNRVWEETALEVSTAGSKGQSESAQTRSIAAKPGIYSAITHSGGFLLRSGDVLYRLAHPSHADQR